MTDICAINHLKCSVKQVSWNTQILRRLIIWRIYTKIELQRYIWVTYFGDSVPKWTLAPSISNFRNYMTSTIYWQLQGLHRMPSECLRHLLANFGTKARQFFGFLPQGKFQIVSTKLFGSFFRKNFKCKILVVRLSTRIFGFFKKKFKLFRLNFSIPSSGKNLNVKF
jgi:hypothetical protein